MSEDETVPTWKEFLENSPPSHKPIQVRDVLRATVGRGGVSYLGLNFPLLHLYCSSEYCLTKMFFTDASNPELFPGKGGTTIFKYICKHCGTGHKLFAIRFDKAVMDNNTSYFVTKFGEYPTFGEPLSNKLLRLLGDDKEIMLKGRQAENQGLGIGAFSYYRRIIENNWNSFLEKIIDVTKIVDPNNAELITELELLKGQTQFSAAVKSVTVAVPQGLMINGQNPLLLLHSALSIGIHGLSDEECLAYATDVRNILSELVERMALLKANNRNLNESVNRLARLKKSPS